MKDPAVPQLLNKNYLSRRRLLRLMRNATAPLLLPQPYMAWATPSLHTLKPGVLSVGTYFVNPPFEFVANGQRVGFEVDLMKEVARRLALQVGFVDTQWESILHEMEEQRFDCIVGGITITPRRQLLLGWSAPYMTTTLSLLVDTRKSPANMTVADLKRAIIGVQAATTDYDAAVAMEKTGTIGGVKIYSFAHINNAIADLTAGRIQAVMKVYPVAAWFQRLTPGLRILEQLPNDPQPLGIGFHKTNGALTTAVNSTLTRMQHDGTYQTLVRRWGLA